MLGMQMGRADVSQDANSIHGFSQDACMEGPVMTMDATVEKPENYWRAGMKMYDHPRKGAPLKSRTKDWK